MSPSALCLQEGAPGLMLEGIDSPLELQVTKRILDLNLDLMHHASVPKPFFFPGLF